MKSFVFRRLFVMYEVSFARPVRRGSVIILQNYAKLSKVMPYT